MNNFVYLLALNKIPRVSSATIAKLQSRWPTLHALFQTPATDLNAQGLPTWLAHAIAQFDFTTLDADLRWGEVSGNHILSWDCAAYPSLLKEIPDPPVILYAQGQLSAFKQPNLAMVGTRNPTITGIENAHRFAKELAAHGVIIVSGLAIGIDGQAHKGCLDAQGQTVAVLGTGIDCIYPRRHVRLAAQIRETGLLISEFPLKSPPIPRHFPIRNRIISGLTLCTLVIEATKNSGSLITARMAMEQNRDVLAIPGSIHNPLTSGCHYLLQQGAKLITCVSDVLDELHITPKHLANKIANPLASEKGNLVQFIGFEMTSIDQLVVRSGWTVEQVTCQLAALEILGTIVSVPGGYMRCSYER